MCPCRVLAILAMVCFVKAQYESDDITRRAADRQRYETSLRVSCQSGDDMSCFQYYLSVNRMYFAIGAGVVAALVLISFCICCCVCCRRKRSSRDSRYSRPSFEAVVVHPDSRSKQSLLSHKTP